MANIQKISLFGTDYDIYDSGARESATSAEEKASQALEAVQNTTSVSYDAAKQALVFSKGGGE